MNERYLFRGKRTDNGNWEIGLLARYNEKYPCANIIDEMELLIPVETKTVGQCTGLKDKNGKLIFEGDIIQTKKYGRVIAHSNVRDYDIFIITYVPAVFRIENIHRAFNLVGNSADYEVIGNIHDNPNLLKIEHDSLCETETYKAGDEE